MRNNWTFLATAIIAFIPGKFIAQCMMVPVPIEQRVVQSTAIALTRLTDRHTYQDTDGNIYTLNRMEVYAWLKNPSSDGEFGLITYGGVLYDRAQITYPALNIYPETDYLVFLKGDELVFDDKELRMQEPALIQSFAYSDGQGGLAYQFGLYSDAYFPEKKTEEDLFQHIGQLTGQIAVTPGGEVYQPRPYRPEQTTGRSMPITSFTPNPTNSGTIDTADFLTISGSGFGASPGAVWFKNADDGGSTLVATGVPSDYVSWSDTEIKVKVLSEAGTGTIKVNATTSSTSLTIDYSHIDINSDFFMFSEVTRQRYYLRNFDGSGGYTFSYNSTVSGGFSNDSAAVASFERALETWRCGTYVNWRPGSSTTATAGNDGVNVVTWSTSLPSGTLGRTTSHFSGNGNSSCKLFDTVWCLDDVDVEFNPTFTWEFGPGLPSSGEYDFESVACHELGHAHGLGHRIASGELMHFAISAGTSNRSPSSVEISGGNAKMAYSTAATCFNPTGCGSGPMVALTSGTCALPISLLSFTATKTGEGVLLNWETASELNNDFFTVERAGPALDYAGIARIGGAGSTQEPQHYQYLDTAPLLGDNYYRLRQTDFDGTHTLGPVAYVAWEPEGSSLRLFPNPASASGVSVEVQLSEPLRIQLLLYSTQGVLLRSETRDGSDGLNRWTLYLDDLPPGPYRLQVEGPGIRHSALLLR